MRLNKWTVLNLHSAYFFAHSCVAELEWCEILLEWFQVCFFVWVLIQEKVSLRRCNLRLILDLNYICQRKVLSLITSWVIIVIFLKLSTSTIFAGRARHFNHRFSWSVLKPCYGLSCTSKRTFRWSSAWLKEILRCCWFIWETLSHVAVVETNRKGAWLTQVRIWWPWGFWNIREKRSRRSLVSVGSAQRH